jgi:hypothetical protein
MASKCRNSRPAVSHWIAPLMLCRNKGGRSRHPTCVVHETAAQPVAGGIMSFGGPICLWCEAADFGFPRAGLVYPSVYPKGWTNW